MEKRYDWSKLTNGWKVSEELVHGKKVPVVTNGRTPEAHVLCFTDRQRIQAYGGTVDEVRSVLGELEQQLKQCEVPKTPLLYPGELIEYHTMADCWVNAVVVGADLTRTSEGIQVKIYVPGSDTVGVVYAKYLRPRSR